MKAKIDYRVLASVAHSMVAMAKNLEKAKRSMQTPSKIVSYTYVDENHQLLTKTEFETLEMKPNEVPNPAIPKEFDRQGDYK